MTDYEVEQRLGYTPCVCGKLDGTWHPGCYAGKTREQIAAGYKRAFAAARRHLKDERERQAGIVLRRAADPTC